MTIALTLILCALVTRGLVAVIFNDIPKIYKDLKSKEEDRKFSSLYERMRQFTQESLLRRQQMIRPRVHVREVDISAPIRTESGEPLPGDEVEDFEVREEINGLLETEMGLQVDNPEQYIRHLAARNRSTPGRQREPVMINSEQEFLEAFGYPWAEAECTVTSEPEDPQVGMRVYVLQQGADQGDEWASQFAGKYIRYTQSGVWRPIDKIPGDLLFIRSSGQVLVMSGNTGWTNVRNGEEVRQAMLSIIGPAAQHIEALQRLSRSRRTFVTRATGEGGVVGAARRGPTPSAVTQPGRVLQAAEEAQQRQEINQDGSINRDFLRGLLNTARQHSVSEVDEDEMRERSRKRKEKPSRKLHIPEERDDE